MGRYFDVDAALARALGKTEFPGGQVCDAATSATDATVIPFPSQESQLSQVAEDEDRVAAFHERAGFLEFDCGLPRAEAERQAAAEMGIVLRGPPGRSA